MRKLLAIALSVVSLTACVDEGRTRATVELVATGAASPVLVDGAFTITLTRADVAFGPTYLCATAAASSELCDTAVLESLQAHTLDGLSATPVSLGILDGVTGTIRSAQYDFGLPFLLGASMPTPIEGSVSGHSVVLEATVTDGVDSFDLSVSLDVVAEVSGTTAMVGAPIVGTIPASGGRVTVAIDPREWLRGLDWASLAATPRPAGAPVVLGPGSVAYDAILRGMTANHPPTLTFDVP